MNKKSRILVNTRILHSPTTGVQRYLQELLARMPSNEIRVESPYIGFSGIKAHLWEQTILPVRAGKNLLWSPANTGPFTIKNQVVSILDMSAVEHPEWFSSYFSKWYQFLLPKLAPQVKKILTISEFSRERIIEICKVDGTKVAVTHLAADQRFYQKSKEDIENIRAVMGLPAGRYILALGTLEPRKNLSRLLKAWKNIQPGLPDDLWLVLSGAKGKPIVFRDISFESLPSRVHLTDYVPDEYLPALYSGALAFVYPSLYEGFGLPPLEAMACGTPVIVSNTTSLPEVVGKAGLKVDPLDIEEIADAIQRLVTDSDLCQSLRQKGLERARLFSWDKTAKLTWKVLQEAAENLS